jgi:hypothetical protein
VPKVSRTHTHPCSHCKTPIDCDGELVQNYDGWPEVICAIYHVDGVEMVCEACLRDEDLRHDADLEQNEPAK